MKTETRTAKDNYWDMTYCIRRNSKKTGDTDWDFGVYEDYKDQAQSQADQMNKDDVEYEYWVQDVPPYSMLA